MFRIRPSSDFDFGQTDEVVGFRAGQPDQVPGLHNFKPPSDVVPGFRVAMDGSVHRALPAGFAASDLLNDAGAMPQTTLVSCTSNGTTFGCTTPRGKSF